MKQVRNGFQTQLYVQVGKSIQDARNEKGFTQAYLAEASALSRTSITNIEKGRQHLPIHTLYIIAAALEKEVVDLLPEFKVSIETELAERIPQNLDKREREWIEDAMSTAAKKSER
jgi:transcriptional regulator with XRE-family HTH domain